MLNKDQVEEANKEFHRLYAEKYNEDNLFVSGDNFNKVTEDLKSITQGKEAERLVDFGSGTGFILHTAKNLFHELVAVDFTEEITKIIPASLNVKILNENTENTSLEGCSADVVSAYSFLHHLYELLPTLEEAFRILKPGGVFYSGMDPNKTYWDFIKKYVDVKENPILVRELRAVHHVIDILEQEDGIKPEITIASEFQKFIKGGFHPEELKTLFKTTGFRNVEIRLDWFLGQGFAIQNFGQEMVKAFEMHLRNCLPATMQLFKYITVFAWK